MRALVCVLAAAIALAAAPAGAAPADRTAAAFWRAVQHTCNAAAAKPPGELGQRIARIAIDEFVRFGGHRIEADGGLFRFGRTEAEHERDDRMPGPLAAGDLGWWQVMKYWRALFGGDPTDKLEVRGHENASTATQDTQAAPLVRSSAARLLELAAAATDPAEREMLREAALRAAVIDTPWSAAFISYVVRQAGVGSDAFHFANAHRVYIYDAFVASAAEVAGSAGRQLYRACPLAATKPRPGDIICEQREPALADQSAAAVRELIRAELASGADTRSVRRTHCEVVAYVDAPARKLYTIGGNVNQAVAARKLNLRRDLRLSALSKGRCRNINNWTLPQPAEPGPAGPCSLNDKKWFVLLQLR